jgi:SAM-dependent methyltransferase
VTSVRARNYDDLIKFYISGDPGKPNIFQVWEHGGSRGDSVTPSTYSSEYQDWMCGKLVAELERNGGGLLSLGCGNAAVEARVARRGFRVVALDAMDEAVALARRKGLEAFCADIYQWEPDDPWSVVYIDGVLGHLYDPEVGLVPVMERIRSWLGPRVDSASGVATIIASNDAPNNGAETQKAPGVNGFYWLSAEYLRDQALKAGFAEAVVEDFKYKRPVSGERVRAIMSGYVGRSSKRGQ